MKVGDKVSFQGQIYTAVKKKDSLDSEGAYEAEIELRSDDGISRFFPEWICDEWLALDKEKGIV